MQAARLCVRSGEGCWGRGARVSGRAASWGNPVISTAVAIFVLNDGNALVYAALHMLLSIFSCRGAAAMPAFVP